MFIGNQWLKTDRGIHPQIDKMLSALKLLDHERIWAIMPFWLALQ
jgi:hypothetical protein